MSILEYTTEDFVLDPEFKKWVLDNDPDAKKFWESFIEQHPSKAEDMEMARTILISMSRPKAVWSSSDEEVLWNAINQKIGGLGEVQERKKVVSLDSWSSIQHFKAQQRKNHKNSNIRKIGFFAVFFISILGFYFFQYLNINSQEEVVNSEYVLREAPAGVKSTVSLPDGSKVMLNSGSSIRYEKSFSGNSRHINLKGEAFFEVNRDTLRPFVVESNGIETKALGTSFNIKAYENEPVIVSLLSGIVEVNSNSDKTLIERLVPGEGIVADPATQLWRKEKFDFDQIMAWMNKTILFNDIPFLELIKILEQWYGVKISVSGSIPPKLLVSGKFKDESLKNILEGLSYSSRFDYTISEKEIQIDFKP